MKLKINGKYEKVGLWSFMKCIFLVQLVLIAMIYGLVVVLVLVF